MHTNHKREDPLVELGYEIRDVNYKNIRTSVLIFFGFAAFSFLAGLGLYNLWYKKENRLTEENLAKVARPLPQSPAPLLQNNVDAKTDIIALRRAEAARLGGTGYNEDNHATVHIPIHRAIDLLSSKGVKPTGQEVPAVSTGNTTDQSTQPDAIGVPPTTEHAAPNHALTEAH